VAVKTQHDLAAYAGSNLPAIMVESGHLKWLKTSPITDAFGGGNIA